MTYEQVSDILDRAIEFHEDFCQQLNVVRGEVHDLRTAELLEKIYLNESGMVSAMQSYETEANQQVMTTWVQYVPDEETERELDEIALTSQMDALDLQEESRRFMQALANFYKQIADQLESAEALNLFLSLARQTEQRIADIAWSNRDADMHE